LFSFRFTQSSLVFWLILGATISGFSQVSRSIGEVQGNSLFSPFEDQEVVIKDAVIIAKGNNEMIVQSAAGFEDGDPNTSDALFVIGDIDLPVGTSLEISGIIDESFGRTFLESATIEIIDQTNKPFPVATNLTAYFKSKDQWEKVEIERYEWMLVEFENGVVTDPSESDGELWMYLTNKRPQREPGLDGESAAGIPSFDENFESLELENISENDISAGSTISGLGFLGESFGRYYIDLANYNVEKKEVVRNVEITDPDDFTIASCNLLFFNVSAGDFNFRIDKTVEYIISGLNTPDIVGVQEVGNLITLERIALDLNLAQTDKIYSAFLEQGNNGSSINSGFLISDRVIIDDVKQVGDNQSLSIGGALHDRPPFLLEGRLSTNPEISFKVLNLHNRSLSGITGSNEDFVRIKRQEQAESVAAIIDNLWSDNLFVLGDFNAYQFSDGYVDVFRQIAGGVSEGALLPIDNPATREMQDASEGLPEEERYSFIFRGNTQQLDHFIFSSLDKLELNQVEFYRGNADAPDVFLSNTNEQARVSDHDGLVVSFKVENPWTNSSPEPPIEQTRPFYDYGGKLIEEHKSDFVRSDESWDFIPTKISYEGMFIFEITGADFRWSEPVFHFENN